MLLCHETVVDVQLGINALAIHLVILLLFRDEWHLDLRLFRAKHGANVVCLIDGKARLLAAAGHLHINIRRIVGKAANPALIIALNVQQSARIDRLLLLTRRLNVPTDDVAIAQLWL